MSDVASLIEDAKKYDKGANEAQVAAISKGLGLADYINKGTCLVFCSDRAELDTVHKIISNRRCK